MGWKVIIGAPSRAEVGETFYVAGQVYDEVTSIPGAGASVTIYYNGDVLDRATADLNGLYAAYSSINTKGIYTLKAEAYGVYSDEIEIEIYKEAPPPPPKISTSLTIGVSPKSGSPPLDVSVAGQLTRDDTGAGIPNAYIRIYRNGVRIASVLTDSYGLYIYIDEDLGSGSYDYYTEFEGSPEFEGCEVC